MSLNVEQFESDFNIAVQDMSAEPSSANLSQLWQQIEPILEQFPSFEKLRLAGIIITHLATIHQLKADRLLTDWEERYNELGPIISEDLLLGLIQKTMYLDISALTRKPQRQRKPASEAQPHDSIVAEVKKERVLAFLDEQAAQDDIDRETAQWQALSIAHEENISASIQAIEQWSTLKGISSCSLTQLQQAIGLPQVQVWLALLLGQYNLQQQGDFSQPETFYNPETIVVSFAKTERQVTETETV